MQKIKMLTYLKPSLVNGLGDSIHILEQSIKFSNKQKEVIRYSYRAIRFFVRLDMLVFYEQLFSPITEMICQEAQS